MLHPAWTLIVFTLVCFTVGTAFMTIFEEVCSTNKAKLRFYLMSGVYPLILLTLFFPMLIRAYFVIFPGSDWIIIITRIGAVTVSAFVLGIGCVACLRTYRERSSLSNDQLIFHLLVYLVGGVASPLLSVAISISTLIRLHSEVPH